MRKMRLVCWLALLGGALLFGADRVVAQVDQDAREACTPDAMRLCGDFIPDEEKVRLCMIRKKAEVSEPCRRAMERTHRAFRKKARRCRVHHDCR